MRKVASVAMAAVLVTAGLMAQGKANFTGKWTQFDPDPAAAAAGGGGGGRGRGGMMGGGWGQTVTITQDATALKVERMQGQATVKEEYKLSGEGKNTLPAFREGGAPTEVLYTSKWEGEKFVITTTQSFNNPQSGEAMKIETKRELSLDASGNLVVTTTRSGMMGGQAPAPTTVKYKKG